MAGDRQLVRLAVAAYFGGTLQTADAGVYFQGGPLAAQGLGTAFPYKIKKGAPDRFYTLGEQDGIGWGCVLTVGLGVSNDRDSYGGATSGWRKRRYRITCALDVISLVVKLAFRDRLERRWPPYLTSRPCSPVPHGSGLNKARVIFPVTRLCSAVR